MQGRMESSALCRVCLASDRAMHHLAGTPLQETYERVTRETLIVDGWPCCVCNVCLSELRRCYRFIEAAHRANIALDRWSRNTKIKLTETPLFSFTRTVTDVFDSISFCQPTELGIKQESNNEDDQMLQQAQNESTPDVEDNILTEYIKDPLDDDANANKWGDCNKNETQLSDNIDKTHISNDDDRNSRLPYFECVNIYENKINVNNKIEERDVKFDISEVFNNVPSTSNVTRYSSTDKDILRSIRPRERVKLSDNTSVPAFKKRRHKNEATHQPRNTGPSAVFHRNENLFSCPECHYKTDHKGMFNRHLTAHSEKPFSCDKCDYKVSNRWDLKKHLLTHTGEKLFSCDKCDYKCSRRDLLNRHLLRHTGEKPLSCDKCHYKCIERGTLNRHLLTHTGEKPFSCNKCVYKCNQRVQLKRHLLMHPRAKPFSSNKCDYKVRNK